MHDHGLLYKESGSLKYEKHTIWQLAMALPDPAKLSYQRGVIT